MTTTPLLEMRGISKSFPGVQALKDVTIRIDPGEVVALVGENGAGKSTLMRILSGVMTPDKGSLVWQDTPVQIRTPYEAQALGIAMIHQELALIPYMDVARNIYLGREPAGLLPGTVNWRKLYKKARAQIKSVGLDIDVRTPVRDLSLAQQQMVEVAKALSLDARLIIMDEPTSSLTDREVDLLFGRMRALREAGVAIVYISHRLEEIFTIADRVIVLRDGALIASEPLSALTPDQVITYMVGRSVDDLFPRPKLAVGDVVLEVDGVATADGLQEITFRVYKGEIVGIAGLVGSGRTELAETIFGIRKLTAGRIRFEGKPLVVESPKDAIKAAIGFVPEDRKAQGLFLRMSVGDNIIMATLRRLAQTGLIRRRESTKMAEKFIERLGVRTPSINQRVRNLSGGNQQKVVIAKWLTRSPKLLILDEPTRGIDIGAKSEIHQLMRQLSAQSVGILMISSELPEVLSVSDRVLVMHEGRLVGEFDPRITTQDAIMRAATGQSVVGMRRYD